MIPEIIDTFPSFLNYWEKVESLDLQDQIEAWVSQYMAQWPDLLQEQFDDYVAQGIEWREIAVEKVFPFIPERLPGMITAHTHLLNSLIPAYSSATNRLDFQSPMIFVIYVGIGCDAGWATQYRGAPAVLFGLENIVECGWIEEEALRGLIAHEIGHLVHWHWRTKVGISQGSGAWWQLYEEGFAQRCELLIQGTWHEVLAPGCEDWLEWCHLNRASLAREFLARASEKGDVRDFFGSWYSINGRSQIGYFLGQEVIRELEREMDLKRIAQLDDIEGACKPILERIALLEN